MAEIKIKLPRMHEAQSLCLSSTARFNMIAAGEESGKTTLGIEALLARPKGAINSRIPVAFLAHTESALNDARRQVVKAIEPLIKRRVNAKRIELTTGGLIDFISLDQTREIFEAYGLIVIDDARMIDGLADLWEDVIRPSLQQHRGEAWILSDAYGKKNDFYRLWSMADTTSGDYAAHRMASFDNPYLPEETRCAATMAPGPEYEQRYNAQFHMEAFALTDEQKIIWPGETFLAWCERLELDGLQVDGRPFTLSDRPAMRFIYELIPSTPEEAFNRIDVIMKCTQVGFTVMEGLSAIYLALKFAPAKIGLYMPSQMLASAKSSERFMPILRTIPDAYKLMMSENTGSGRGNEGNIMIRNMGRSRFHFLWTSGRTSTESFPLDVVTFDECQEMAVPDMEKTRERMSASNIRYTLMGSTANWPDSDIHWWYKKGTQHQFHTKCIECGTYQVLDEHFPECIGFDPDAPRLNSRHAETALGEYRYRCHACTSWIDDSQVGEWRAINPKAEIRSVHFPQFLSPTISAREIIEAYYNADDLKNFYNRKLGKPFLDPTSVPVNLEMLNECAKEGMRLGVAWKDRAKDTFMGIDQMGSFNVVLIAERLPTGHMAIIHAEEIYSDDPFARCDDLIAQYGVQVCVVETLPNYNDAKRFAGRHLGKVFLAGYMELKEDMLRWGDSVPSKADRKTAETERDRYTVMLDQYKCMQVAMKRIQTMACVFPDPKGLLQEIKEKGIFKIKKILEEVVFFHFTRTALIAAKDDEERKYRRKVIKIGIDPHFSYAYMLLNVAWSRAFGTTSFILPDYAGTESASAVTVKIERDMPGLPSNVVHMMAVQESMTSCGNCSSFNPEIGLCAERRLLVRAQDAACPLHIYTSS